MPTPIISETKFNIWNSEYVYGLPGQTEASVYVAQVDDLVINYSAGTIDKVVSVNNSHVPTLAPFRNASGFDGEVLDNHPSVYQYRNRRVLPDLNIWYSNTGGSTPKAKLVAQPDSRVLLQCKDAATYRIFLGNDCSDTNGTCISGDPSVSDLVDTGTLSYQSGTYQINSGMVHLAMHLRQGEVVSVVFYDNTNNVISIRPMKATIRGALQNTYSTTINGYAILSKFNSTTDYNFLDCRFTNTINKEDFGIRKFISDGTYVDLPWDNTECTIVGLDAFISGDSYYKTELTLIDKSIGFSMVYRAEKGGSSIIEVPTGVDPFDWSINQYDLVYGNTIYNGNERPEAVSTAIVIYPKDNWEVNARPTVLTFEGVYNGSNDGGKLGTVTVFDKAGNKISYNNVRTYTTGDGSLPNTVRSVVNLYYVGDNDIGGALITHSDTDLAINKIIRSGSFTHNFAYFGLQSVGSIMSYATDVPNNSTSIPLELGDKRSVDNELPIAAASAFVANGGYPWNYGHYSKPVLSNIRYGEYLIPYYGTTPVVHQGIEFLGSNIDLQDNQYIIEAVFCLRSDYTFDPSLAEPILALASNPQTTVLQDSAVVVPVRPYVVPPDDTGPVSPNPSLIPRYVMDPTNNVLFELPPEPGLNPSYIPPGYQAYGMVFPNIAHPEEIPEDNVYMIAGVPPWGGHYMVDAMSEIPKIAQIKGTAVHLTYKSNDSIVLSAENIPSNQPYFFSFWRTTSSMGEFVFQTSQRRSDAQALERSPKLVLDTDNTYGTGIHCILESIFGDVDNTLMMGVGVGQGPYYQSSGSVPKATDGLDHFVVYNSGDELTVYCNKVAIASIPIDYNNFLHNQYLFGSWQSMQLSNVVPIYRSIGIGSLELYYGTPDQDFVDYLFDKTAFTGFNERMYVDDIFNVINKNLADPYFIKAQGEKLVEDVNIIYKSSMLLTNKSRVSFPDFDPGYETYRTGYDFINWDDTIIPWRLPIGGGSGFSKYFPVFDLRNNIGVDNKISFTCALRPHSLTHLASFFYDVVYPQVGIYNLNPIYEDCLQNNRKVLDIIMTYPDPGVSRIVIIETTPDPYSEFGNYYPIASAVEIASLSLPGSYDVDFIEFNKTIALTMVYNKVANTMTLNVNYDGLPITENTTFNGRSVTFPFTSAKYRYYMPGGIMGYEHLSSVADITISKKQMSVDEYNTWVSFVHDNQDYPFRGGVIAYDTTKRAYIEDLESMYVTLENPSLGGAVMRYRNINPIRDINGIMVTTKTNPSTSPNVIALDKLSLLPLNDITEIEWRIKIYTLSPLSTAVEEGVFLLEKHTDEDYNDGYTLQWGGGFYTLVFNTPSNITDTGLTLTSPTSNILDVWHTGKYVINGNTIAFYLNETLITTETFPVENARRIHTAGPLRIGTSITNSDGTVLDIPTGGLGFASTDFDLDYLKIKQNGVTTFNLHFGVQNIFAGSGGGVPPALPYFVMKVGDNELKVDTVNKRVAWINAVEGLLVEPTTDLLAILNRNIESINVVTLVRKGPKAAMFINGTRVWYNSAVDYDEDVGAQPVLVDWGITTQYGPVPYLQSLMVYSGASWIDAALVPTGTVTIPITDIISNSDFVRIDNTIINNASKVAISNVVNFSNTVGYPSILGDIIRGTYPWI